MENIFLTLFSLPFFYFNYKILVSDFYKKIIPNKYLVYLLLQIPFYYIFIFITKEIDILKFFVSIPISFFISFLFYYYWIWSAWDAKYLLVLSLFIPYIWTIPFIWNLWLLTIWYLFLYFIYFYLWKCIFKKNYAKYLLINIYRELKDKFLVFVKHDDWNIYRNIVIYKVLKWIVLFLIIFVWIRLTRLYIIQHYIILLNSWEHSWWWLWWYILKLATTHSLEFVIFIIFLIFWGILLFHKWTSIIRSYITKLFTSKKWINTNPIIIDIIFISILITILSSYIVYEFINNPYEILKNLKLIFTFYIFLYLIFRLLRYSYKITFQLWEQDYIMVANLKSWDVVDKAYLISLFWTQTILWAEWENQNKDWILYPNPKKYFEEIENPIDLETAKKIQESVKVVNEKYKKEDEKWFHTIESIKILKTFAFWPYIFVWFIVTLFYWNYFFELMKKVVLKYLQIND